MAYYQAQGAEEKLTLLIWYLVRSFPLASILSRQVGDRYHVFIIVPFDGSQEKTVQVETNIFQDQELPVERFAELLSTVNLRRMFDRGNRYDFEWRSRQSEAVHIATLCGAPLPGTSQKPVALM